MTPVYGLTGGIACGKTAVAGLLEGMGVRVIDADQLARDVVAPGQPALREIAAAFGARMLREDGTLDRPRLGALVFGDDEARARLEAITHPRIREASLRAIVAAQAGEAAPIFYDAALLVEQGRERDFAGLVVVTCSPELQRARIVSRDGLSPEEAEARIAAQLPLAEKEAVADHVIRNDGTWAELDARTRAVLEAIRASA